MPGLAFCANCGLDRVDVTGSRAVVVQVRCYVCTKTATVPGIVLGEVDLFADAKTKVAMLEREEASGRIGQVRGSTN